MKQDNCRSFKILIQWFIFTKLHVGTHFITIYSSNQYITFNNITYYVFVFFHKMYYLNKLIQHCDSNKNNYVTYDNEN